MTTQVVGLVVVGVFYVSIVVLGILAARWTNVTSATSGGRDLQTEMSMVAGRNLGLCVGIFTMAATSVGGGYLSGTVEGIATVGLAWTVYPFTILLAFVLGSVIYARPMREKACLTMLDPLQCHYGNVMTSLLMTGALLAEILWGASLLIALGTGLGVILDLQLTLTVGVSAAVVLLYTMCGQMVAVAYTDVVQFLLLAFGMILCVLFAMTNDNLTTISMTSHRWLGKIERWQVASWLDFVICQTLGGIPWNTYIMRILSAKSVKHAQIISAVGGTLGFLMAIPPFLLGIVGTSVDWSKTELGISPVESGDAALLLPLVVRYLTPEGVCITALSAIVAAVMSSMDSIILSSSSMFTHNIYRMTFRKHATNCELRITQLVSMVTVTFLCTVIAISVDTIYGIFILAADVVYIILFPQLTCAVFVDGVNSFGSFCGFIVGLFLRLGAGEPTLKLSPFLYFPFYDENHGQLFPYKTFAMLTCLATIICGSYICQLLGMLGVIKLKHVQKQETDIHVMHVCAVKNDTENKSDSAYSSSEGQNDG